MHVRHESSDLININLFIQHCSFINGTSYSVGGGLGICTQRGGSFNIINSTFTHNFANSSVDDYGHMHGGGMHIQMNIRNNVTIVASRFSKNIAIKGGGFYISITEERGSGRVKSNLLMSHVLFDRNIAKEDGGHGYISLETSFANCKAVILHTVSDCLFERGHATSGGAISMNMWQDLCDKYLPGSYTVKIKNSKLTKNSDLSGAVFYIGSASRYSMARTRIHLSGSHIANNTASVSVIQISSNTPGDFMMIISKTTFYNNTITTLKYTSAVLYLEKVSSSLIMDTTFSKNFGTCIRLIISNITLKGYVQFHNNTACAGTALLFDCQVESLQPSFLILLPNTTVTIANNNALYYGGGLAVNPVCKYNNLCFFQASSLVSTKVYLFDNKALISANSIYGPPMTHCVNQGGQIGGRAAFTALFEDLFQVLYTGHGIRFFLLYRAQSRYQCI